MTLLFNNSLNQGMVPQEWKKALVTPIHKKGNKKLASNYRSVSLTSITCKIIEKIMYSFIIDHIYANNYFSNFQHRFIKGRSTTSQLLEIIDHWTESFDLDTQIDCIYLDFNLFSTNIPYMEHHFHELTLAQWCIIFGNINALLH